MLVQYAFIKVSPAAALVSAQRLSLSSVVHLPAWFRPPEVFLRTEAAPVTCSTLVTGVQ